MDCDSAAPLPCDKTYPNRLGKFIGNGDKTKVSEITFWKNGLENLQ